MPTSGTHITIVQQIASDPAYQQLLGNPHLAADDDDPEAIKMRFANLGAVGPDIFYALADYGSDLQALESFLIKIAGTFECVTELMGRIDRVISGAEKDLTAGVSDSLTATSNLITGVFNEGLLALVVKGGLNLLALFEPARQRDWPRNEWYWGDYLHYVRSGQFARTLVEMSAGKPNRRAYAYGYLTHYVTDVVGHPYVNQVVQSPWRLYWQRHHLVENFIDAYVWDRWHVTTPMPANAPAGSEQPSDTVVSTPNAQGSGAPFTFARLNDLINIGHAGVDPVDDLVEKMRKKIEDGLFDPGAAEDTGPDAPADADFDDWAQMVSDAIKNTYWAPPLPAGNGPPLTASNVPIRLTRPFFQGVNVKRNSGYPEPEDVAAAYGVFRLLMLIGTEEKIKEPQPPDIIGDISEAVQAIFDDIAAALGAIPPPPAVPSGPNFSLESLLDAIKSTVQWVGDVAAATASAAAKLVQDAIKAGNVIASEPIKYGLYLLNKALFALYRSFRDVLMLQAYCVPFTDQLTGTMGPLDLESLWRSVGNLPAGSYPREEVVSPAPANEQDSIFSTYAPHVPPTTNPELPTADFAAPYTEQPVGGVRAGIEVRTIPDDFITARLGPDDMFLATGPQRLIKPRNGEPSTFASDARNFGGAIANSTRAIDLAEASFPAPTVLPDYNLDADRGYAWPCWDVSPAPTQHPDLKATPPVPTDGNALNPAEPQNRAGIATVNAVPAVD
jgi:hypothetical protein